MTPDADQTPSEYLVGCFTLAAGDTISIVDPRAVLVYVSKGRVWITEERDPDDTIVAVGGWHRIGRPGNAVIEAFAPSVVMLTAPYETGAVRECVRHRRPLLRRARRGWRAVLARLRAAWRRPRVALRVLALHLTGSPR